MENHLISSNQKFLKNQDKVGDDVMKDYPQIDSSTNGKQIPRQEDEFDFLTHDDSLTQDPFDRERNGIYDFKQKKIEVKFQGLRNRSDKVMTYEKEALYELKLKKKLENRDARMVTNYPFYSADSREDMIEIEADRPLMIFNQILMKNSESLLLQSREKINQMKVSEEKSQDINCEYGAEYGQEYGQEGDQEATQTNTTDVYDPVKPQHGLDILCNLFYASDHSVREIMTKNLHCCKLATPFILPSGEMLLYPLQSTQQTWNSYVKDKGVIFHKGANLFKYPCPIISFIRVGKCKHSKSKLINELFFQKRDTFMNRYQCNDTNPKTVDGLVEIQWYTPCQKKFEQTQLKEMITILNLRGDATNLEVQVQMLKKVSDLVVIISDSHKNFKGSLFKVVNENERNFLWIAEKNDALKAAQVINQRFLPLDSESNQQAVKNIRENISLKLNPESNQEFKRNSIEKIGDIYKSQFNGEIDLDDPVLSKAKQLAEAFKQAARNQNKNQIVPLQSSCLWGAYTEKMKQLQRITGSQAGAKISQEIDKLRKETDNLRRDQRRQAQNLHPAMNIFTQTLSEIDPETALYFIEYITIYLNERNAVDLKEINLQYSKAFEEFQALKEQQHPKPSAEEMSKKQKMVEARGQEKIDASFGLEHLLRECGQIYECRKEVNRVGQFEKIPKMIAQLLLKGIAIEFMDGENAYVPTQWVSAILQQLDKITNSQEVHVQSIIGTQSSGKSTFLNCQYNSKFAVAAERCTKGIYFQLLEIDEKLRKDTKIRSKFIINLDTEGLRAPELVGNHSKSIKHDNEMGTFIISIADLTTLNIDGLANINAMTEILDIVVHAVLKIRDSVSMQPQIHFVHQKVDDSNPEESNREARLKITNALDANARKQAELLDKAQSVRQFSDVIPTSTKASYVNSLFEGQQGNTAYSTLYLKKVHALKLDNITSAMKLQSQESYRKQTFASVGEKLQKLWNCILAENFAFAFQNATAIIAYREIEKIQKQHYDQVLIETQEKKTQISQHLQMNDGYKIWTAAIIDQELTNLQSSLIGKHSTEMEAQIKEKITETKNESLQQFERDCIETIHSQIKEQVKQAKSSLISIQQSKNLKGQIDDNLEGIKTQIKDESILYYKDNKNAFNGKTDSELEQIFKEQFWSRQLKKFKQQLSAPVIDKNPSLDVQNILEKDYRATESIELQYLTLGQYLFYNNNIQRDATLTLGWDFLDEDNFKEFIDCKQSFLKSVGSSISNFFSKKKPQAFMMVHKEIMQKIDQKQIEFSMDNQGEKYDQQLLNKCLKMVDQITIAANNSKEMQQGSFKFKKSYTLRVKAIMFQMMYPFFQAQIQKEKDDCNPEKILDIKLYPQLRDEFQVLAQGLNINEAQAVLCGKVLQRLIIDQKLTKQEECHTYFFNDEIATISTFQTKKALISKAMIDMINEKLTFEQTQQFIRNYEDYANNLIGQEVNVKLQKDKVNEWVRKYTNNLVDTIKQKLRTTFGQNPKTVDEWLRKFIDEVGPQGKQGIELRYTLPIDLASFERVNKKVEIGNDELRKVFQQEIEKLIDPNYFYSKCNIRQQFSFYKNKSSQFIGCTRTCHFCGVVCDNNTKGHKEKCQSDNHRIVGLNNCTSGPDYHREFITHYNCNFSANENGTWTVTGTKFNGKLPIVQKNGKDCFNYEFKKFVEADEWLVPLSTANFDGTEIWQWYLRKYELEIKDMYFFKDTDQEWKKVKFTKEPSDFGTLDELKEKAQRFINEKYI